MESATNMGGIVSLIMLAAGIVLTVITIRRMVSGQIDLPKWTRLLLAAVMILGLLVTLAGMLPPEVIQVDNFFVTEYTEIVQPEDP